MLEDFISANGLKAEIVTHPQPKHLCRCELFLSGEEPIIAVVPRKGKVSAEKVREILGLGAVTSGAGIAADEVTGYDEKFLPPVSIYGASVVIDSSLQKHAHLFFEISEGKFLKISPQEIEESNDVFETGDIME